MITALIVLAGGLGAGVRFVVDGAVRSRLASTVPWSTIGINVTGSLLLGVLTGLVLYQGADADLRLIAGTGFCGGYTTFSTASVETVRLVRQGRTWAALVSALGTLVLCLAAAALGLALTS